MPPTLEAPPPVAATPFTEEVDVPPEVTPEVGAEPAAHYLGRQVEMTEAAVAPVQPPPPPAGPSSAGGGAGGVAMLGGSSIPNNMIG